ncbi:unnamed protein product [Coccothraustes coccothraustes]
MSLTRSHFSLHAALRYPHSRPFPAAGSGRLRRPGGTGLLGTRGSRKNRLHAGSSSPMEAEAPSRCAAGALGASSHVTPKAPPLPARQPPLQENPPADRKMG